MRFLTPVAIALLALGASGCEVNVEQNPESNQADQSAQANSQAQPDPMKPNPQSVARAQQLARAQAAEAERAKQRQQAIAEMQGLRLVVDQSDRKLRIYKGEKLLRTHDVAVGTEKNPTPIGEFAFNRVDINPEWIPPSSEWAEDRERKAPGAPDNPMGRARLVYKMPYTIHGTDDLNSLGKAVSHGSIRLANEHVIPLAEMMLKAGGSWEGQQWFQKMTQNRSEEYQIPLEQQVPLKIQE